MGKRGAQPKFTDVFCPNQVVSFMVFLEKEISQVTAHIKSRTEKFVNTSVANAVECSMIERVLFDNLRKDEYDIKLALKVAIKGMSIKAIADVLEV